MAKQSGLGDQLFVDGYDLSGDVGSVQRLGAPSDVLDVTAIIKSARERIYSLFDGMIEFACFWNVATDQEHDALKAKASGADRVVCYFKGSGIGNMAAGMVGKQVNYDWNRGTDGALLGAVQAQADGHGLDFGEQLTAGKRTDTGATNGSSLNAGASSAKGLAAYLQVFDFDGTDVTVKLQESSDNGAGDAFADVTGGAFAQVTSGPQAQRLVTSLTQTVEQYLRVATVTSGGFSSFVFAVMASRYPVA